MDFLSNVWVPVSQEPRRYFARSGSRLGHPHVCFLRRPSAPYPGGVRYPAPPSWFRMCGHVAMPTACRLSNGSKATSLMPQYCAVSQRPLLGLAAHYV
jgi:hypothetical protein